WRRETERGRRRRREHGIGVRTRYDPLLQRELRLTEHRIREIDVRAYLRRRVGFLGLNDVVEDKSVTKRLILNGDGEEDVDVPGTWRWKREAPVLERNRVRCGIDQDCRNTGVSDRVCRIEGVRRPEPGNADGRRRTVDVILEHNSCG